MDSFLFRSSENTISKECIERIGKLVTDYQVRIEETDAVGYTGKWSYSQIVNIEKSMYLSCDATCHNLVFLGCKVDYNDHILQTNDESRIVNAVGDFDFQSGNSFVRFVKHMVSHLVEKKLDVASIGVQIMAVSEYQCHQLLSNDSGSGQGNWIC